MSKPNILFVFSDQHRWCDLGSYGNEQIKSPNFDAFAREAVRFENCISNSPLCVPARGTLLTGLLPMKHGAISNDLPIRTDVTSVAHVWNEAGYHTGYIGKWHLAGVPRDQPVPEGAGRLGFKEWKVYNCSHSYMDAYYHDEGNELHKIEEYEPIKQTDLAIDFMKRNKNRKWALYLSWGPPHDPYFDVPEAYLDLYAKKKIKLRDNVSDSVAATTTKTLNREQIIENYKGYFAHITALDEQFARLREALEVTGQADNTIVVYTSDHGDMIGSHGLTNKQLPYEESVKVPLMVYWKGKTFAGVCEELIGLVDLPVSLTGLLGLRYPG
jgi:arylsulfatase A-like enzyme